MMLDSCKMFQKAVWNIPYVSVAFSPSLKQNFIAYRSSKMSSRSDCIFEIHQLRQSEFSMVCSNFCCSCSFELEIIKIGQSSPKMYSNKILNVQESTTILNACTKKSRNLLKAPHIVWYSTMSLKGQIVKMSSKRQRCFSYVLITTKHAVLAMESGRKSQKYSWSRILKVKEQHKIRESRFDLLWPKIVIEI